MWPKILWCNYLNDFFLTVLLNGTILSKLKGNPNFEVCWSSYRPVWGNPNQPYILDSTPWIPDSLSVDLGSWIPNSMSCISNSKAQDSSNFPSKTFPGFGFHKQSVSRFRNPDSFAWGEKEPESRLTCESLAQIEGASLQRETPRAKPQREELIGRMGRWKVQVNSKSYPVVI